mmetsp:Transcript_11784/g.21460  ORF Transcript_11784/g.21460 Transcript_11784/m.21460 type:complete len:223 (+) Transcript_11784:96-764(+)
MAWRRLFGADKEPAGPAPTLQEASSKIDLQVQSLEEKIAKCEAEVREYAQKGTAGAKARAMQVMKRKQMYETQRNTLLGQQANVENMVFSQEQAEVTLTAVQAMQAAQKDLQKKTDAIGVAGVDKLMDDMAETKDQLAEINGILAQGTGVGEDDAEFEAEFAALQEQMAQEALLPGKTPAISTPTAAPAAAETEPGQAAASTAGPSAAQASPMAAVAATNPP